MANQRARDAEDAAERACVVARSAQRIARTARLARLPEALGLAKSAEGLAQRSAEATNFARRATIAAKLTAVAHAHAQEYATKVPLINLSRLLTRISSLKTKAARPNALLKLLTSPSELQMMLSGFPQRPPTLRAK